MAKEMYSEGHYRRRFGQGEMASQYYKTFGRKIEAVLDMMQGVKGRILDVGCADGTISMMIKGHTGSEVYGIDINEENTKTAKAKGIIVKAGSVDGAELPYETGFFDAVYCGDVLEHVIRTDFLLEEMFRVLKKGGFLVLSVPNTAAWYNRLFLLCGWLPIWVEPSSEVNTGNPIIKESFGHLRAFTKNAALRLLRMKGYAIEEVRGIPVLGNGTYPGPAEKAWNLADRAFAAFPTLASLILIKAGKR